MKKNEMGQGATFLPDITLLEDLKRKKGKWEGEMAPKAGRDG